jgi:hypothetical protein
VLSFAVLRCILQAELEASAESGATVKITLPDSGKQIEVAVGQDWVEDTSPPTAAAAGTAAGGTWFASGATGSSGSGGSVVVGPVLPVSGLSGGGGGVRTYRIKWVQDESGALAMLEVVPAVRPQQQQQVVSGSSSGSGQLAIAPVAF